MTAFATFTSIDVPNVSGGYTYISVVGVDAAGEAVGYYGNVDGDDDSTDHGFIASGGVVTSFDPPGSASTDPVGITPAGEIFGNYDDANKNYGFIDNNGTYGYISVILSNGTIVSGVDSSGEVYGTYYDEANGIHGFIDNKSGFTGIDVPGASYTTVNGVAPSGEIVGQCEIAGVSEGFVDIDNTFTTFSFPGAINTAPIGVNASGEIFGNYEDAATNQHGFIEIGGVITAFDVPGATYTAISGFNDAGEFVGFYVDGVGNVHGFVSDQGVITTIDAPGATQTDVQGITASGVIYGFYDDATGAHGFVGTLMAPEFNVTVQTPDGVDLRWTTLYDEMANSPINAGGTATHYTAVDSGHFNGHAAAIKFVVSGTGFTYSGSSPNIELTGGTVTGMQMEDSSGNVLATFSNLLISAAAYEAALNTYVAGGASPDPSGLDAIFLAASYTIAGGAGPDRLQGGDLDDTIIGSTGNDTIAGGTGTNTADYSNLTTPGLVAIIEGGSGTVNKGGANGVDTLTGVGALIDIGTGRGNGDVFEVDSAENVTASSSNFNYLIELSTGVNLAYGTDFTGISEFVSNVGANTVSFAADANFAYLYGSTGDDTLTLGSGGGYLFGEGGTNVLTGGANATNLFVGGDGGTDTMNGGSGSASNFYFVDGNDQVNGAGAFNAVIELVAGVTVQLGSAQYQHVQEFVADGGTNTVTVAISDSGFVYLYGGTGDDTLTTGSGGGYLFGEGGSNVLTGGGGTNVFVADGASGADIMNGGSGSNIYFIDANSIVSGAGTFNTIEELQQSVSLTLGSTQLGNDVQEVVLDGGTNMVDFSSATGAVYLYGAAGDDTLFGGSGNDFLYGGAGTNTFEFAGGWGHDTIMDWTSGTNNQIDLTALAAQGVHGIGDLTQTIVGGSDVITSSLTGTSSITLHGVGGTLSASSFHFA